MILFVARTIARVMGYSLQTGLMMVSLVNLTLTGCMTWDLFRDFGAGAGFLGVGVFFTTTWAWLAVVRSNQEDDHARAMRAHGDEGDA